MAEAKHRPKKPRVSGISAAAIEGAREGETSPSSTHPDDNAAKVARPQPGMTDAPTIPPSSTGPTTGVTGGILESQEDEQQEWRRAGGGNPDVNEEPQEPG